MLESNKAVALGFPIGDTNQAMDAETRGEPFIPAAIGDGRCQKVSRIHIQSVAFES